MIAEITQCSSSKAHNQATLGIHRSSDCRPSPRTRAGLRSQGDFRPQGKKQRELSARGLEGAAALISIGKIAWAKDDRDDDQNAASQMAGLSLSERKDSVTQRQILELYDAYNLSLYSYLRSLGVSADKAEDVIQETFLRLVHHLRDDREQENLRAWLYQVAHNLAMDIHRASNRSFSNTDWGEAIADEPVDPHSNPEWQYLQKEELKRVKAAIQQLTPQQRGSLLLRAEGLRYREIALVLGVSEQRAIHLVKRGLERLAEGL
ncbi:RNA polymerase sigma factor [Paracidobacterium acidisoli]|uniref:RNA polymerase sigma factor n=1 Tax=Paracidobacterium acidisoli TaxID=2303751 RepID=A0A372IJW5_9BACT|nr:RNA polymerase sigma factor [Paracidobacterium acidisoli]MBT9333107.1 RNA polymerase sigma factor [Paracidobacterium acidisoli]